MQTPSSERQWTRWQRFWHQPVRAERLAATRLLLGVAVLADQLMQYLPNLAFMYGPNGMAPAGLHDQWPAHKWRWTIFFFNTDNMVVVSSLFWVWVGVAAAFLVGWRTRLMTVLLYLLTLSFTNRNLLLKNSGDDLLLVALFLMLFAPSGRALSFDSWLRRRRKNPAGTAAPSFAPAWPVRLLQIQLCTVYLTTALSKLVDPELDWTAWLTGPTSWWDGTSIHYALNFLAINRWSFAQLPLPFWVTAAMTYVSVGWELLFTPLVLFRRTRWLALWFGILLHLGIWLALEVGWFSFYTIALYGVWIPGEWWDRFKKRNPGQMRPAS